MSEKQTHTPGPWVVKHDEKGLPFIGVESDPWTYNGTIASVDTSEKDARLIASAPELLEQCKLFEKLLTVMIMEGDSGADLERDNLRAILDRVEGESA
mgnify:FL=1|tara:strand:+ start:199 stop:492 length:294 start_codon:yes stop_codon:yes gene_type:complete